MGFVEAAEEEEGAHSGAEGPHEVAQCLLNKLFFFLKIKYPSCISGEYPVSADSIYTSVIESFGGYGKSVSFEEK